MCTVNLCCNVRNGHADLCLVHSLKNNSYISLQLSIWFLTPPKALGTTVMYKVGSLVPNTWETSHHGSPLLKTFIRKFIVR